MQAESDGDFQLRLRTTDSALDNAPASWRFTIDSTPPRVTFTTEPPKVVLADTVLMKVSSNEEGVVWHCALLQIDGKSVDPSLLRSCSRVQGDGSIKYAGLRDGSRYTFALRATDAFGNASPVATRRWLVDASAPRVHGLSAIPQGTRDTSLTLRLGVTDGKAGTGVASVECGVRWLGKSPETQPKWGACKRARGDAYSPSSPAIGSRSDPLGGSQGSADGAGGSGASPDAEAGGAPASRRLQSQLSSAHSEDTAFAGAVGRRLLQAEGSCRGCTWYEQQLDTKEQGMWGFTIRTADNANQTFTSEEAAIFVDRVAPQATFAQEGRPRDPSPPELTVPLDVTNPGRYKSPVVGALCALLHKSDEQSAAFEKQRSADVLLQPKIGASGQGDFSFADLDGDKAAASFATWHLCAEPVSLSSVPSGRYVLHVKALDAAGNAGDASTLQLTVDASLDPNDPLGLRGRRALDTVAIVFIALAAGLVVATVALAVVLASRRRRKNRAAMQLRSYGRGASHDPAGSRLPRGWHVAHVEGDFSDVQSSSGGRIPAHAAMHGHRGSEHDDVDKQRMSRALELSMLEAGVSASRQQHHDDEAMKLAIQKSLREQRDRG